MKESDSWEARNKVKSYDCTQLTAWREFPGHGTGTRKQKLWWSCWVEETMLGVQEAKDTRVQGRALERREACRERALEICRGSSLSFELNVAQCILVRKLTEAGGKELERTIPQRSHKTESNFSSYHPEWKNTEDGSHITDHSFLFKNKRKTTPLPQEPWKKTS